MPYYTKHVKCSGVQNKIRIRSRFVWYKYDFNFLAVMASIWCWRWSK